MEVCIRERAEPELNRNRLLFRTSRASLYLRVYQLRS